MTRRIQTVFFDATDTLLRVRGSVGAVYAPVAARYGLQATVPSIDRAFQAAMRSAPPPCFPDTRPHDLGRLEKAWWQNVVRNTFEPLGRFSDFEDCFEVIYELFRTTEPWELLPGAHSTLAQLAGQGRRLGVVSDMDSRLLDVLDAFDLDRFLDPVVLATQSGASKRDGGLFDRALEQAGVRASRTAHVGDSLSADVAGALAAGITPIYLDASGRDDAPAGTARVRSLTELPALLDQIDPQHGSV